MDIIAERLRQLRGDTSPGDLAAVLGCSEKVYLKYETGEKELRPRDLIKLRMYYNVPADYIIGLTDEKEPG